MSFTQVQLNSAFKNILLATDFSTASQAALHVAILYSKRLGAHLTILHVFEYAEVIPPEAGGALLELDNLYHKARQSLAYAALAARQDGLIVDEQIAGGIAADTILEKLNEGSFDLVVLGTTALHGIERLVFGSTAETVLRKARCPALTVGPRSAPMLDKLPAKGPVIFATDFHARTTLAISYAASISKLTGAPLHCLHVLPRRLQGNPSSKVIPHIMTEALQRVAHENGTAVEPAICAVAYGSEISNAVVDYATRSNAGLIVLGIRQASLMAAHVPPHIAYRIIAEAPCPVLTVAFMASGKGSSIAAACL